MRWSEADYLSRIVLSHAPRQVTVSLILAFGRRNTKCGIDTMRRAKEERSRRMRRGERQIIDFDSRFRTNPSQKIVSQFILIEHITISSKERFDPPAHRRIWRMKPISQKPQTTEPNKAVQTTPVSVMPRAIARVTPATSVSDLRR
jgi:hypothetical protein